MPNEVTFDLKMIDIKMTSNVPNSKEFSLTSNMFDMKDKRESLTKYPVISGDFKLPVKVLNSMNYEDCVVFFFSYNTFSKVIKDNIRSTIHKDTSEEANNERKNNLEYNGMIMLKILFGTKFPYSNNVITSLDMITNNFDSTENVRSRYTYLKLNNLNYTVIQVIWLNDMLNNPFYVKMVDEMSKYIKWAENARTDIINDISEKKEKLDSMIKQYNSTSVSRDITQLNSRINMSTNTYDSNRSKYEVMRDYISNLGKTGEYKKIGFTYAVKFRGKPNYYILTYNYESRSRQDNLGFRNKFIPYSQETRIDEINFIDTVDWNNSEVSISIHIKSDPRSVYRDLLGYFRSFWGDEKYNREIPKKSITHDNDKFIIQFSNQDEYDEFTKQSTTPGTTSSSPGTLSIAKVSGVILNEEKLQCIIDEQVFYNQIRITKLVLLSKEKDENEELFNVLLTLYSMNNYARELSKEYKDIMNECNDIEEYVKKNDFLKKILTCNNEPCTNMDINSSIYKGDFFKPYTDMAGVLKRMISKNRKLVCNTQLQKELDDYSSFKDKDGLFAKKIYMLYDIMINRAKDIKLIENGQYNTSISEINFGKQNMPKYELYTHIDLLEGKANKKNLKNIKCNFKDERFNTKLTNWLYSTGSLWKIKTMPFLKLEKIAETSKKKRSDKPSKLPPQGGSKTRKNY